MCDLSSRIASDRLIESIDGEVASQGFRVKFPGWMVMGSLEWDKTTDKQRAYAYQAAKASGWTRKGLIVLVTEAYSLINEHTAKATLDELEYLVSLYPLQKVI